MKREGIMVASPAVHHASFLLGGQNGASKSRFASLRGGLCAGQGYREMTWCGSVLTEEMLKGFYLMNCVP